MSILDDIKAKVTGLLEGHGDKVSEGLDKVRDLADEKTGGNLSEQIDDGVQKAKDALGGEGKN
jgi:MT0933-like antitoxin protein